MTDNRLHDAEYRFMEVVWELEPVNSTELHRECLKRLDWKKSTTYTVLRKLCERGILKNEDSTVTALVKREDVQRTESRALMEKLFDESIPGFLTAFLGDRKISKREAEELKNLIETFKEE